MQNLHFQFSIHYWYLAHLSWKLKWAFLINICPSSGVRRWLFTFLTSSQEPQVGLTPNLVQMFYTRSHTSVVTFRGRQKSKMATMASDWLRHFELLLKNHWLDWLQTWYRCSTQGPTQVLSLIHISEPTRPRLISYAVFCLKKKIGNCLAIL